jgi:putative transposase
VILSYKYRIYPNKTQATALGEMLADFCMLYNACLEQRITAYERRKISLRYKDQAAELKAVRIAEPDLARWSFSAEQQVLRKLEKTFAVFFGRLKRGAKAGFPRFRSRHRYHAADFRVGDGLTLRKSGKLGLVGVPGEIKVRWHRELPSTPKSAILTRQNGKWFVIFHVEVEAAAEPVNDASVGIDVGLTTLAALSTGEMIDRPNFTKQAAKKQRRLQRALARCKRGSKRRRKVKARLAEFSAHTARRRTDYLHKVSADLASRFGKVAFEDLNIKGLAAGMLAKHVNDAAWAQLISFTSYKVEKTGGETKKVNPCGTSQECPGCGRIRKKQLSDRIHRCDCGCVGDRDTVSSVVIHYRAFGHVQGTCIKTLTERIAA